MRGKESKRSLAKEDQAVDLNMTGVNLYNEIHERQRELLEMRPAKPTGNTSQRSLQKA